MKGISGLRFWEARTIFSIVSALVAFLFCPSCLFQMTAVERLNGYMISYGPWGYNLTKQLHHPTRTQVVYWHVL